MIVVLDTNILISAIFWRGNPYEVVRNALKKKYSLYLSTEILNELEEKLRIKFKFPEDNISNHIELLKEYGKIVVPISKVNAIKEDPDDNKVLECAETAKADYIVSGDAHLLKLKEFKGIKIVTAKEFLGIIN
ncbi:MAG: putative toxin-antitoxin system toxin component, PIN family [Nanoarchaeota archaeon]